MRSTLRVESEVVAASAIACTIHVRPIVVGCAHSVSGELAPLAADLLRTESASSSRIEGVTACATALVIATLNG
jgi:hypothetical protein